MTLTEALDACAQALESFDVALVEPKTCEPLVASMARVERLCRVRKAQAALRASVASPGRSGPEGSPNPAHWLAEQSGESIGAAKAALETVEALEECPATKDAVESGELSLAQAKEIAAAELANPGVEDELLDVARRAPMSTLRDQSRKKRHEAIGADELHHRQHAARTFRWWRNEVGNIAFAGEVPPEHGVPFVNRLGAETDRLWLAVGKDTPHEPRERYAADALVKMIEGGGKGKATRADIVIVVDLKAWRRGHAEEGEVCHIIGGGGIPVPLARELATDAFFKAVIHDGENILTLAHFGRKMRAELRSALELGPPPGFEGVTCSDERCGAHHGLEWDHVDPVANDGPSAYWNLDPKCRPDHRKKTERDRAAGLLRGRRKEPDEE